ncbi:MAG: hypothetical protein ONB48_06610 [candidate division KSB1 bacterium]|nr:hypothetical protein [candidate division KSB1 bacterium]MDZ7273213.1 hypothetical protein [candidate division KSB1 bacterium]MDZ7285315.1 hypothetical protein [candidate division KSB1 bacterium]MDZ7298347.1 hypothetical protein [candidate division KSB1 bacterium]MDZ7308511.1 hypothetical protein [candidate division KSB1 bacterium]
MQANLFSNALEHKERALAHLDKFELKQAWECLEIAREIDPYLADLDLLAAVCQFARYANAHPRMSAQEAAAVWHAASLALQAGSLGAVAVRLLRQLLARRLLQGRFTATLFCAGGEKILHRGVCHLVLGQWQEAHRDLLDLVAVHPGLALPVHWGYLGDAAHALKLWKDANLAYLRLLFSDPHQADVLTLQHPGLRNMLTRLLQETGEETEARGRWPFYAWWEDVIHIPAGGKFLLPLVAQARSVLGGTLLLERKAVLQQFMLCLYVDQAQLQERISFDVRLEMQRLDADLFAGYLAEVRRRQGK